MIFILVVVGAAWLFFLGAVFIEDWPNCAKLSWRKGHRIDLGIGGSLSHSGGLEEGTDIVTPPPAYVSSRNRNPERWTAPPPAYCMSGHTDLEDGTELGIPPPAYIAIAPDVDGHDQHLNER
jgi:hypothetical protein